MNLIGGLRRSSVPPATIRNHTESGSSIQCTNSVSKSTHMYGNTPKCSYNQSHCSRCAQICENFLIGSLPPRANGTANEEKMANETHNNGRKLSNCSLARHGQHWCQHMMARGGVTTSTTTSDNAKTTELCVIFTMIHDDLKLRVYMTSIIGTSFSNVQFSDECLLSLVTTVVAITFRVESFKA